MSVAVLVGLLASACSLYAPVPQIVRAVRSRSAEGVSWTSLVLSLMTFTLWVVYAIAVADAIQIINNTLALGLLIVLGVTVMRTGVARSYWTPVLAVFLSAAVSFFVVDLANSLTLALVGTLASTCRLFPQTRLAISGAPMWGLCPWSTLVGLLGLAGWTLYGALMQDVGLALCSGIATVMQLAIVFYRLPPRRTLDSLAGGRLGPSVAQLVAPASARFPYRDKYKLAA